MSTWTDIPHQNIEPEKPIRAMDIWAISENIKALYEGADGAPRVVIEAMDRYWVPDYTTAVQLGSESGRVALNYTATEYGVMYLKIWNTRSANITTNPFTINGKDFGYMIEPSMTALTNSEGNTVTIKNWICMTLYLKPGDNIVYGAAGFEVAKGAKALFCTLVKNPRMTS